MIPADMFGAQLIGQNGGPTEEQIQMMREQQRIAHIEMYRQMTAQQCMVAMIVKSMAQEMHDEKPVGIKLLAKRAKEASDALCVEIFGEESQS